MEVRGRDLVTGLPHTITLASEEVEEALRESAYIIVHTAKSVLEQTPPELSADIIDKGIETNNENNFPITFINDLITEKR